MNELIRFTKPVPILSLIACSLLLLQACSGSVSAPHSGKPATLPAAQDNGGGMDSGGGDEIGLEFKFAAENAIGQFEAFPSLTRGVDTLKLRDALAESTIVATDRQLPNSGEGILQEGIATNIKSKKVIEIQRQRWKDLKQDADREAIALHEILSLAGYESTGDYSYTSKFLNAANIQCIGDDCIRGRSAVKAYALYKALTGAGLRKNADGIVGADNIACEYSAEINQKTSDWYERYFCKVRIGRDKVDLKGAKAEALFNAIGANYADSGGDGHIVDNGFNGLSCWIDKVDPTNQLVPASTPESQRAECSGVLQAHLSL